MLEKVNCFEKTVLVRADLNVPIQEGKILDFSRIYNLFPTLDYLKTQRAKVILLSHFGRPDSNEDPSKWGTENSLAFLGPILSKLSPYPFKFIKNLIGSEVEEETSRLKPGEALLLENTRFHPGEKKNDPIFAQKIASLGDLFINDAFSCCHRHDATIVGLPKYLLSYKGISLEKEIKTLNTLLKNPKKPFGLIVGGKKVSTKISLLEKLCIKADLVFIGGAMANSFFVAQGYDVGNSFYEKNFVPFCKKLIDEYKTKIVLPFDVKTYNPLTKTIREIRLEKGLNHEEIIYDGGSESVDYFIENFKLLKTLLWNGPIGFFEHPPFEQGTRTLAEAVAHFSSSQSLISIIGGGDTLAALNAFSLNKAGKFSHISTGGGAFLEWIEKGSLPGIEALAS